MNLHPSKHALLLASLLGALAGCSAPPEGSGVEREDRIGTTAEAITSNDALARAEQWVAAKLPYCQSANHQPDGDKACSAVCTRPDNPAWDAYRSDCSGLVSWAWGLPAPGRVTWELAPAQTDITSTIPALSLEPGDAVNKPHDHTMLFKAWLVPGKRATFIEEPGCSSSTPYAHEFDSDVTISGTSITVAFNGITFDAIRYTKLVQSPDAGASDASAHDGASPDASGPGPQPGDDAGSPTPSPTPPGSTPPGEDAGASKPAAATPDALAGEASTGGCAVSRAAAPTSAPLVPMALALFGVAARRRRRVGTARRA
jgi:hypothetical protein